MGTKVGEYGSMIFFCSIEPLEELFVGMLFFSFLFLVSVHCSRTSSDRYISIRIFNSNVRLGTF